MSASRAIQTDKRGVRMVEVLCPCPCRHKFMVPIPSKNSANDGAYYAPNIKKLARFHQRILQVLRTAKDSQCSGLRNLEIQSLVNALCRTNQEPPFSPNGFSGRLAELRGLELILGGSSKPAISGDQEDPPESYQWRFSEKDREDIQRWAITRKGIVALEEGPWKETVDEAYTHEQERTHEIASEFFSTQKVLEPPPPPEE